ncbi:MAG TPA: hypothetical protein VNS32_20060, partial [Flavisolibacter sp.]|nr:hypothetical protein [Flavisolibacter sp.]
MSSFQSAGVNNMVNLFTGDFSYNIPLLDVGGYPVNLFYSGGIGSEQEASWVGLGWNINPGSVNRNVRGVPDDFNGDELTQVQNMKPNSTWGANFSGDVEVMGAKDIIGAKLGLNLGVSYNNYLGPALEMGVKGGMAFKLPEKVVSEKSGYAKGSLTINESVSSRYGVTITPNFSFTAKAYQLNNLTAGLNMTTSYNSRTGIRSLQVSDQMSFNSKEAAMGTSIHTGASGRMATSISFTRPSYIPSLRMPVTNTASSEHVQLGYGKEGVYASAEVEVYKQFSEVQSSQQTLHKPMVGYLYAENAQNNPNAVMDFTRFNDKEVTPKTPVISVPQYTYDVFSIQGEGTGGSIRAYRNDLGAVRDNFTQTKDKSNSGGGDASFDGISHFGGNFITIKTP